MALKNFINEVIKNYSEKKHGLNPEFTEKNARESMTLLNNVREHLSSSGKHTILSGEKTYKNGQTFVHHYWINNKTRQPEFHVNANIKNGAKDSNEVFYHDISSSSKIGANLGHHAYWDLMSGRTGKAAIMVHDNQSVGATKLRQKIRKTYGSKVLYHTYDPKTNKAEHLTHGVTVSGALPPSSLVASTHKETPQPLFDKHKDTQIIGMVPKKYRYQHAK